MSALEKRKVERTSSVLIVNFRHLNKSRDYILGIANNYSHEGISFEATRIESNPGEVLELILKNPYSELSLAAIGEMVWKVDGWYKCITGIKLKEMDKEAISKLKELMTDTIKVSEEPSLSAQEAGQSQKIDKGATVICETKPDAEIKLPHENTSFISKEEIELPAEEETEKNKYRCWANKFPVISIFTALLLIVSAVFAVITLVSRSADIERIQQPALSQNTAITRNLSLDKVNSGPVSVQDAVRPIKNKELQPDNIKKAEKPVKPQNTAAVRQPPLQRETIKFDSDSDVIRPVFHSAIDKFAKRLLNDHGVTLKVEGYSDSIGPELYNLDLAMRRALEVKKLLMRKGVSDRRIKVTVYGESYLVSSDIDEFDNAGDRRVDMVIVPSS
jgi:outer membrane protein OmpA-like peptidoglycan-associated protein